MSVATAEPRTGRGVIDPRAGTGGLVRLALRRDRVRITVWFIAIALTAAVTVVALDAAYPDAAARQARAAILTNPSAVMMTGPAFGVDDYTLGAMVANELSLALLVAVAIMSILFVVRQTRAEEETGRSELIRALPVGHDAPATAAVTHVAIVNLLVGAGVTATLIGTGLEMASSIAFGLGTALTGLVFGAVAAVTTQVTAHARAASGMAMGVLAVSFLARGIGDVISAQGSWLSWLSPIAWAQQTRLFVDLRWWPLALSVLATMCLLVLAVDLAKRRDMGGGLRPDRPGPPQARNGLLSVPGLAWRLLRSSVVGWTVALVLMGAAFGGLANSLEGMLAEVPEVGDWIGMGSGDLVAAYGAAMASFLALGLAAFGVASVLRLRGEEDNGRTEMVLATGASRRSWLAGWGLVVALALVGMTLATGLGLGIGVAAATGAGEEVWRLAAATIVWLPAVYVFTALAIALVGAAPRFAALAWAVFGWTVFVSWLGAVLDLPQAARDVSPFEHTPLLPSEPFDAAPLLVLASIALALTLVGLVGIRRRDVPS